MFIADLHNIHVYCGDTTYLRSLYTPCYLPHPLQTLCQPTVSATCIALHVTRFGLSTDPDSHRKPVHPASVLIANCLMSQQLDSVSPLTPVSHIFRLVPSKRGAVHPVFVGSTCERTGADYTYEAGGKTQKAMKDKWRNLQNAAMRLFLNMTVDLSEHTKAMIYALMGMDPMPQP